MINVSLSHFIILNNNYFYLTFPGEYVQNLCNPKDSTCAKCPSRLPSCVGQSDGFQPFPSHLWEEKYIQCYKNRTMKVAQCPMKQYFNPRTLKCADKVVPGRILFWNLRDLVYHQKLWKETDKRKILIIINKIHCEYYNGHFCINDGGFC